MFDARREGFDPNRFKRAVKDWIKAHPDGTETELADFCEEQIPPAQYQAHQWLVEHTISWYRHILAQRLGHDVDAEDEAA